MLTLLILGTRPFPNIPLTVIFAQFHCILKHNFMLGCRQALRILQVLTRENILPPTRITVCAFGFDLPVYASFHYLFPCLVVIKEMMTSCRLLRFFSFVSSPDMINLTFSNNQIQLLSSYLSSSYLLPLTTDCKPLLHCPHIYVKILPILSYSFCSLQTYSFTCWFCVILFISDFSSY